MSDRPGLPASYDDDIAREPDPDEALGAAEVAKGVAYLLGVHSELAADEDEVREAGGVASFDTVTRDGLRYVVTVAPAGEPVGYMNVADIAALFGVDTHTVHTWQIRYGPDRTDAEIAKAPCFPKPDAYIGLGEHPIHGWSQSRVAEIRAWNASRPGQGAGGGRPKKDAEPE